MDLNAAEKDGGVVRALHGRIRQFAGRQLILRQPGTHVPLKRLQ